VGCRLEGDDVVARFFSDSEDSIMDHAVIEVGKEVSWVTITKGSFVFEGPIANRRIDVRLRRPVILSTGFRALGATLTSDAGDAVASLSGATIALVQPNAPSSNQPSFSCADVELFHPSSPAKPQEPPAVRSTPNAPSPPPVAQLPHIGMPTFIASSPGGPALAQVQRCIPVSVLEKRGTNVRIHYADRFVDATGWVPSTAVQSLSVMSFMTSPIEPATCADALSRATPWGTPDDVVPGAGQSFVVVAPDKVTFEKWNCSNGITLYRKTKGGFVPVGSCRGVLRVARAYGTVREVFDVPIDVVVRAEDLSHCTAR
jgi:hypothetical protein